MGRYVESEAWMVTPNGGFGKRTYRAYVPHRLQGWEPDFPAEDQEKISAAEGALHSIISLPFSNLGEALSVLMAARDESIYSSIIEGVHSTPSRLDWARYRKAAELPISDQNDALTLGANNQIAFALGLGAKMKAGGSCSLEDLLEMHLTLFAGTQAHSIGGKLRDWAIWIGPHGCLVDEATYVAPPPELVPDLLADLLDYLNTSQHSAVVKSAIAHVQFEMIHPFEDGNGRTGRAVIQMVLNAMRAARGAVPISASLSHNRRDYYRALQTAQSVVCEDTDAHARSRAFSPWIHSFAQSCEVAANAAVVSSRKLEAIATRWKAVGRFRNRSNAARLLAELPAMPVFDVEVVATRLRVGRKSARRAIASLESVGIVSATGGRRNRRFYVPDLVDWLSEHSPDGTPANWGFSSGYAQQANVMLADQLSGANVSCDHLGIRSRRRCRLPAGHAGQHRYL